MVRIISVSSLSMDRLSRSEVADGWFDTPPSRRNAKTYVKHCFLPIEPCQYVEEGEELDFLDDPF